MLNDTLGEDSFKKYSDSDSKHKGAFLVSAFQGIATGVYSNINKVENIEKELLSQKIKNFYEEDEYKNSTRRGARAVPRFIELTEFGKEYFSHED